MRLPYLISTLVLCFFGTLSSALAGTASEAITVSDPYVRAMPPGQPTTAGFLGLTNNSGQDHAVVVAEAAIAKAVELHTHIMEDGMMHMRRVEKIDLPAGQTVMLQPGGLHIMFIGLKMDLMPGDSATFTLIFEDGSEKRLNVPVRKPGMNMGGKQPMDHSHH